MNWTELELCSPDPKQWVYRLWKGNALYSTELYLTLPSPKEWILYDVLWEFLTREVINILQPWLHLVLYSRYCTTCYHNMKVFSNNYQITGMLIKLSTYLFTRKITPIEWEEVNTPVFFWAQFQELHRITLSYIVLYLLYIVYLPEVTYRYFWSSV